MKKVISLLLMLTMVMSTVVLSFGTDQNKTIDLVTLNLPGFSYEIHGNDVDRNNAYNVELTYQRVSEDRIRVMMPEILGVTSESMDVLLDRSENGFYVGTLEDGTSINLEFLDNGNPILDVIKGDRVYAFGNGRRTVIENYIEDLQNQDATAQLVPQPRYAGGTIKTAKNDKVYMKAVWNPSKSNRLAIRVNTQGTQFGTEVQGISIKNGKVPSAYVVKSLNPTGMNTSANFVNTLSYIINSVTYLVKLPSFSNKPVSGCNGNSFNFNVNGMSVKWDSLNNTNDSTSGTNGMMFYVFLDDNLSTKPTPTGTISIRYRVVATGAFDATLAF